MEQIKPLVIVLSRNYSTGLGVIRSLGEAGYPVDLVASVKQQGSSVIASCSRYVRRSKEVLSPKIQGDTGAGLVDALLEYVGQEKGQMVVFPTDDFTASVVASYHDVLSPHFLLPEIRSDRTLVEAMDKTVQAELARECGLLTAREWVISLRGEITVPEDMVYPCFVKPQQSISGHKTEMAACDTAGELREHLEKMQAFYADRCVLVQEYLDIDREFDLSGICLDQEIVIPAVIEKTRIAQFEKGVTMSGRILSTEVLGELVEKMKELLRKLRYVGMFDMELNQCGDKVYFNEINLRSGGPNYAYCLGGVNLPAMLVGEMLGEKHDPKDEIMPGIGKTFVYEKVAWEDYIHGCMTRRELEACIRSADFTLLDNLNDPAPGHCFAKRIRLSAAKHRLKQVMGKEKRSEHRGGSTPGVVIMGRNFCNILTMTRALGEAGYDVEVLRIYKKRPHPLNPLSQMKPDAKSKYVGRFTECVIHSGPRDVVQTLLKLADPNRKKLLVPVDDYAACVADDALEILRARYILPNVNDTAGEISWLMDKNVQKELAAKADLPLLKSWLISSEGGRFTIPMGVEYPCFIKPNVSMNSTKATMRRCNSAEELESALEGFAAKGDFEMLVEEFADIRAEYSVLGLSTPDGTVAPGLFRVTEGGHRERRGVAITGETVACEAMEEVLEKTVAFIDSLHYTGLFDVDLLETKDGKVYFIELNFRAGASTHVFTETGVNLPGMLADYLLRGIPVDQNCRVEKTGQRFVSEKVLMEEFARSDASWQQVKDHMAQADVCFIRSEKDPKPYRYFQRFYPAAALLRLPYRLRDGKKK